MSNTSKLLFGPRLRAHRERRGITLDALAASTKISRTLIADLERNDVSRWPSGIYRRAFVREYARAIGLQDDDVVAEFCELFPDPDDTARVAAPRRAGAGAADAELRLLFAEGPRPGGRPLYRRLLQAAGGLGLVLAIGCVAALVTGAPYWTASGITALIWYPATAVLRGHGTRRDGYVMRREWARLQRLTRWVGPAAASAAHPQPAARPGTLLMDPTDSRLESLVLGPRGRDGADTSPPIVH